MNKTYFSFMSPIFGVLIVVVQDGTIGWTTEENDEYLAWVAEGNTAEQWNPENEAQ